MRSLPGVERRKNMRAVVDHVRTAVDARALGERTPQWKSATRSPTYEDSRRTAPIPDSGPVQNRLLGKPKPKERSMSYPSMSGVFLPLFSDLNIHCHMKNGSTIDNKKALRYGKTIPQTFEPHPRGRNRSPLPQGGEARRCATLSLACSCSTVRKSPVHRCSARAYSVTWTQIRAATHTASRFMTSHHVMAKSTSARSRTSCACGPLRARKLCWRRP